MAVVATVTVPTESPVASPADASAFVVDRNWTDLPENIIVLIIDLLGEEIANLVCFGSVCSCWRSVMQNRIQKYKPKIRFPWRLLEQNGNDAPRSTLRFYSFTNQKQYSIGFPSHLPMQIVGHSNGFIGLVPRKGKKLVHIYNPITGAHFTFPRIKNSDLPFIKFIVNTTVDNSNSNSRQSIHVAFLTSCFNHTEGQLLVSIAKVGDTRWRHFDLQDYKKVDAYGIDDIMFHKHRLYVVTKKAQHTLVFDLNSTSYDSDQLHPVADLTMVHKAEQVCCTKFVESTGKNDLFLIMYSAIGGVIAFVHKVLRFDGCRDKWEVVRSIVSAQFSFYHRKDSGLYSVSRLEGPPLIGSDKSEDKFVAIDAINEAQIELKVYSCDDDTSNWWFSPSL